MVTEAMRRRSPPAVLLAGRVVGAGLTAAMGRIQLYLWANGYSDTPTIGVLFLLNGIGAAVLTIALLGSPARLLEVVSGLAALFTAGALAALIGSLTVSIFGFWEYLGRPLRRGLARRRVGWCRGACRSCRDVEGGLTRRLPPVGRSRRGWPGRRRGECDGCRPGAGWARSGRGSGWCWR